MNLPLTEQEAKALVAMLDFATKAQGLLVAETCVVLAKKIEAAAQPAPEPPPE